MASLVFLVHGMGAHPVGWSAPLQTRLQSLASELKARIQTSFALTIGGAGNEVLLHEIEYDSVFTDMHARNARSAQSIQATLKKAKVLKALQSTFDWLATAGPENEEFFLTHVADVLLFRALPDIRQRIITHVAEQMASVIADTLAALPPGQATLEVSVLAHSLGTSVAQQTLEQLATRPVNGKKGLMIPFEFRALAMVANVSRVLERSDVYRSVVGPPARGALPSYVGEYLSFRHALDPFTLVRTFAPSAPWSPPLYRAPKPLEHLLMFNVHDWEHYLVHPAVHLPLFNTFWNATLVQQAAIDAEVAAYAPTSPNACLAQFAIMRTELQRIAATLHESSALDVWWKGITEALVLARQLGTTCKAGATL